ncbi:Oidioi.mRNA.OKI2018_I69.chr1.g1056.t1.cds [Oikopleura dioica]|uniref:Oidioi.mRNA.OKI2018_I69.chr1.g1056.t1.cds n=1 Tax=Oikopleura dioica TaxID=34765 RepID=A0ABN7SQI3_OIKDI|nr:Oidioi.mRNA.OKI2018_I69.chr1.g1056.t1.cds [Oikopleura dioica]
MKVFSLAFLGFAAAQQDGNPNDRIAKIEAHVLTLIDSIPVESNQFKQRYTNRLNKVISLAKDSMTGDNCHTINGYGAKDEEEDVKVFSDTDFCKLNSQINSALSSFARNWACIGRGKTHRQVVRRARKIKAFYNYRQNCSV